MSLYRDPKCVFVTDRFGAAETLVVYLSGEGIAAEVMDPMTRGGLEGLTGWLPGKASTRGVEVWVRDVADADRARELVATREAEDLARAAKKSSIVFDCEECGKQIAFPASLEGTVQECPHCLAYVDVPDSSATFDFGVPEEDDA